MRISKLFSLLGAMLTLVVVGAGTVARAEGPTPYPSLTPGSGIAEQTSSQTGFLPDLQITEWGVRFQCLARIWTPSSGFQCVVSVPVRYLTVGNTGVGASSATAVRVTATGQSWVRYFDVPTLSGLASANVDIDSCPASGAVTARLDPTNTLRETNENNNTSSIQIWC
jgi:subtilase family serine protease